MTQPMLPPGEFLRAVNDCLAVELPVRLPETTVTQESTPAYAAVCLRGRQWEITVSADYRDNCMDVMLKGPGIDTRLGLYQMLARHGYRGAPPGPDRADTLEAGLGRAFALMRRYLPWVIEDFEATTGKA